MEVTYNMSTASSSFNGQNWPQFPIGRQDSFSSDEDGLREVLPEELEDLELGNASQHEPQVALDLPDDGAAANEANPHFNANWEPEHSGIAKKIGMYVKKNAFISERLSFLLSFSWHDSQLAVTSIIAPS